MAGIEHRGAAEFFANSRRLQGKTQEAFQIPRLLLQRSPLFAEKVGNFKSFKQFLNSEQFSQPGKAVPDPRTAQTGPQAGLVTGDYRDAQVLLQNLDQLHRGKAHAA